MSTLSKGSGVFSLSDSDMFVGSFFSPEDIYEILEIDLIPFPEFCVALKNLGLLSTLGLVDEKMLYRQFDTLKNLYSTQKAQRYTSLDEYVLKRVIARTLPEAIITQQVEVRVPGSSRAKKIDFKIESPDKVVFVEFDGPSHYVPQYGQAHDSSTKKKAVEDATGLECVIWPYWMQRCRSNVLAIFNPAVKGLGALWSTNYFFGDFVISNASNVIIEETKRFNAIDTNGFGYFYGANAKEQRHITPHGIINRILKRPEKIKSLIPPDWDGDKEYWLPEPLWDLA